MITYFGAVTFVNGGIRTLSTCNPFGPVILEFPVMAGGTRRRVSCMNPSRCGRVVRTLISLISTSWSSANILFACSGYFDRNQQVAIKAARVVSL